MASTTQPQHQTQCRLFKIPGELRNRIYREVLLEPQPIEYTRRGFPRPGLLNTCKAIRYEALKIYYYENSFHTDVFDYNLSWMRLFKASMNSMGLEFDEIEEMTTTVYADASWDNLMEWLRCYHADLVDWRVTFKEDPDEDDDRQRLQEALSDMFDKVTEGAELSWDVVEAALWGSRWELAAIDEDWGPDEEESDEDSDGGDSGDEQSDDEDMT